METIKYLFIPIIAIGVAVYYIWLLFFSPDDEHELSDSPYRSENSSISDDTNKLIDDFKLPLDKYEEDLYDYNVNTIPLTKDEEALGLSSITNEDYKFIEDYEKPDEAKDEEKDEENR